MKSTRNTYWILIMLLGTFFLASCGGGGKGTPNTAGDMEATNEEPVPIAYKLIAADQKGDIWHIDENDGSSIELLDVYIDDDLGNRSNIGEVSSMVYDETTEKIYAGTGESADCSGCIYAVDPSTGEAVLFMDPEVNAIPAMAIRSDGKILASFEGYDNMLYEFDPSSGNDSRVIGILDAGNYGVGLSFLADGTLLLGEGGYMGIVNQDNGEIAFRESSFNNTGSLERINPNFWPGKYNYVISETTLLEEEQTFAILDDNNTYSGEIYRYLVTVNEEASEMGFLSQIKPVFDGLASAPVGKFAQGSELSSPASVSMVSGPASVQLTWKKVFSGIFNVYWSASPGVTPSNYEGKVSGLTGNSHHIIQGEKGTRYYAIVTMTRTGVESEPSDEVSAIAGGNRGYQIIDFAPESNILENRVALGDDNKSAALPVGFNFTFFGNTYSEFVIFSNGFISFDTSASNAGDSYMAQDIPLSDDWNNIIALAWTDISPQMHAGRISYETLGIAPDRRLVVSFSNVSYYGVRNEVNLTTQAILYEESNFVEIHTTLQDSCREAGGDFYAGCDNLTQGVENADGTEAFFVPGRVRTDYSLYEDAVRFYTNP